jgi:hypothetical protein
LTAGLNEKRLYDSCSAAARGLAESAIMTSMWFKRKPKSEFKKPDAALRQRLMDTIKQQQLENEVDPVVSLDDFFMGNNDEIRRLALRF